MMSSDFNPTLGNPLIQRVRRHAGLATLFRAPLSNRPSAANGQPLSAQLPPTGLPRAQAYTLPARSATPYAPSVGAVREPPTREPATHLTNPIEPVREPSSTAPAFEPPAALSDAPTSPHPVVAVREPPTREPATPLTNPVEPVREPPSASPSFEPPAATPYPPPVEPVREPPSVSPVVPPSGRAFREPLSAPQTAQTHAAPPDAQPGEVVEPSPQSIEPANSLSDAPASLSDAPASLSDAPTSPHPVGAVREPPPREPATHPANRVEPVRESPSTPPPARVLAARPAATARRAATARPAANSARVQRTPSANPYAQPIGAVREPPPQEAPPSTNTQPPPAGANDEAKLSERDWSRLSTIMRRHQGSPGADVQSEPAAPASPHPVGTLPEPPAASQATAFPASKGSPPPAADAAADPVGAVREPPSPGLEAVWPVQHRASDSLTSPAPRLAPPAPLEVQVRQAEHIQRALAGVSSGQPTGSKIEVIPPRQPRPAAALQRAASPAPEPTQPAADTPGPARLIDTEIGPLPADLWGLVGQPAPPAAKPLPAPTAPADAVQRTVIINDFETRVTPSTPGANGGQTPAQGPQSSQSTGGEAGEDFSIAEQQTARPTPAGQPPATQAPAGPDLDEIARQVYAEVKNRLQVEWERLRRRL